MMIKNAVIAACSLRLAMAIITGAIRQPGKRGILVVNALTFSPIPAISGRGGPVLGAIAPSHMTQRKEVK